MESAYLKWENMPSCPLDPQLVACLNGPLACPHVAKVQRATVPLLLERKSLVVQVSKHLV